MKFFFLLISSAYTMLSNAQITANSLWTWMKGDTTIITSGVYGTQGIAAEANKPGTRGGSVSWADLSGNLWLFGGLNINDGKHNDLWKYDPGLNQWTWIKGDTTIESYGVYGTQGIAAEANKPGSRYNSVSWIDLSGNLWLFGGLVSGSIFGQNDLWKYDPGSNQWTWMKGDTTGDGHGIYGTKGMAVAANNPGTRRNGVSWTDLSGNLWLFGGFSSIGRLNDLWKYDPGSNQWTWMKGDSTGDSYGIYGVQGIAAEANKPGAREGSVSWRDLSGNLWFLGGDGRSNSGNGLLNDLWKYNPGNNRWTWIKGDSTADAYGIYGSQGIAATVNNPGARYRGVSWTDISGNLWLLGGVSGYYLNDLWKYDLITNNWTWIRGDSIVNQSGVYGAQGIGAAANKPGSRYESVSWKDPVGNFWLFGGIGLDEGSVGGLNDLWKLSNVYTFTGNGDWDTATNWESNLVANNNNISAGTVVIIDPSGQCTQTGNITTHPLGKLIVKSGKILNLNGDLNNAGNIEGSGTLNLAVGTSALNSTGSITTSLVLSGKQMILNNDLTAGSISLTNGSNMQLGNFNLKMDTFSLIGNNSNFIITNGTGTLNRKVGSSPVTYPVGINSSSYTPATISNAGTSDTFSVRVGKGVLTSARLTGDPITSGTLNNTWFISKDITSGSNVNLTLQWNLADEQSGFDRNRCYISHFQVCPPPINCTTAFYDAGDRTAASGPPGGPFTLTRDSVNSFETPSFIVSSLPVEYNFIGTGDWNNTQNWTNERVPPRINSETIISDGMEIFINPSSGVCNYIGKITLQPGGKLTVQTGKILNVKPN